jgi:hypothetical protein
MSHRIETAAQGNSSGRPDSDRAGWCLVRKRGQLDEHQQKEDD